MAGDGTWLTIGEFLARLRDAGYTESESTIRRIIDDGEVESYRTNRGRHRRIKAASAEAFIARRNNPTPTTRTDLSDRPDVPAADAHDDLP